jgi:esterase/lipase
VQFLLAQSGIMHIGVVGGGLGANAAIIHAATFNDVKALVTLSPTLNDRGLQPIDAFKTYDGPLYVMDQYVDPDDDKYHGHSVDPVIVEQAGDLFFAATTEDKDWFQVKEGGRGWTLVKPDSDVEKNMITFFTTKL